MTMIPPDEKTGSPQDAGPSHDPGMVVDGDLIRPFVEHWGVMARAWGINASMGELFALLYVTGSDWTAESLREALQVSRGNVSMNLRELIAWGVVHKVHRQGERREFYRAEDDVWTLFRRILGERKRRELDPTLLVLRCSVEQIPDDQANHDRRKRLVDLQKFFALINQLATRLLTLDASEIQDLGILFGLEEPEIDQGKSKNL
jgi:DNA-binding transcriptional regulator GbsR (MarR family)